MDSLAKWSAHIVDLRSLFCEWERRRVDGHAWTTRFREIYSVCMFTLCIENGTDQRYLIGFQQHGTPDTPVSITQLFEDNFGEIQDCDILLVDDPKRSGEAKVLHHRSQLVSFMNQPSTSEKELVAFLEKKKLKVAPDDDLRLIIHVEQEGPFNYGFLWAYLTHRQPQCPYSQVFAFGQCADEPRRWFCIQVYPDLAVLPELDEETAGALVLDREQYNRPASAQMEA